MKLIKNLKLIIASITMLLLSNSYAASIDSDLVNDSGIFKLRQTDSQTFAAGQPSKEQFAQLKEAGIKHVINLRVDGEIDWDEKALIESLGMQYHPLPIAGKNGITLENAKKLTALIEDSAGEGAIVHCGSSNRVGALIALDEFAKNGGDLDAAISKGKAWGMTRLEPYVREQLTK